MEEEQNTEKDELEIVLDGIFPFEVEELCGKLKAAGVAFMLEHASKDCMIDSRENNAIAAITRISNIFSEGGLTTCYRIAVRKECVATAREALGRIEWDKTCSFLPSIPLKVLPIWGIVVLLVAMALYYGFCIAGENQASEEITYAHELPD